MRAILNSNLDYRKVAKEILGKNDYYSIQKYSSFGCSFLRNWESERIHPKRNCDGDPPLPKGRGFLLH